MRRFEEGMSGYTYLEEEPLPLLGGMQIANAGNGLAMQPRDASAPPAASVAPEAVALAPEPSPSPPPPPAAADDAARRRARP